MTEPNPGYLVVDGVQYVTTAEAAARLGDDITEDMIRDWTKRGLLKPAGRYGGRSNIYRYVDVAYAERRARLEPRGRARHVGELQKITTPGHNLPTKPQTDPAQKQRRPRCTVLRDNGQECNRFAVPDAPFRICRDHMRAAFHHWNDHLTQVWELPPEPPPPPRSPDAPPLVRQPFVYYVRFSDRIKIGHSVNVRSRLDALPHDEVLALEPGPLDLERMRHHQFEAHRITRNGEWFRVHPELLAHTEMLVRHFGTVNEQLEAVGSQLRPRSPLRTPEA